VLIDELDLHLHPNWQKRIVADLKSVFQKIQFVATTHSPFIVQSLRSKELINLDTVKGLDNDPNKYSVEEISESEMGVENVRRSKEFAEMQEKAAQYFQLVKHKASKDEISKVKKMLDELRIKFSNDPAYVALLESEFPKSFAE
jgi:predicted ATP-binding protein involved in virulence